MQFGKYRVALISATSAAIGPATDGLRIAFPEAETWNLVDDRLMTDATSAGGVTSRLSDRMRALIAHAVNGGADAVLLTCSMYGELAQETVAPIPVHAPDQASFATAASGEYRRVLIVASFQAALDDAVERFTRHVNLIGRRINVTGIVAADALAATNSGDQQRLSTVLGDACAPAVGTVDAVLLAQYSLAPAQAVLQERLGRPVISGPTSAATALRSALTGPSPSGTLGAIADDYTGGTDIALAFQQAGLRTVLFFTKPPAGGDLPPHDAIVIALKSRTCPPDEAVIASLDALAWLHDAGADQIYFKYCSTFDSTSNGNIGPVLDALSDQLSSGTTVTTPSSPGHGRTVYQGQLFVDGKLLAESHMARHPLTPMTDSYLPRLLANQSTRPVDVLSAGLVRQGPGPIRSALSDTKTGPQGHMVADATSDDDLGYIAQAVSDHQLVSGAAGLGSALATVRARSRSIGHVSHADIDPVGDVAAAVLAGSSSARTLEQIEDFRSSGHPSYQLLPDASSTPQALADAALTWLDEDANGGTPLIYSSMPPDRLRQIQQGLGISASADLVEAALALTARGLVERGIRRLVLAGGETSGSVIEALGVAGGAIGQAVSPGVPWVYTIGPPHLAFLLKSGNFGDIQLFSRAIDPTQRWGTHHDAK